MSFTLPADYTGFYKISGTSHVSSDLQVYIDSEEPDRLRDLLGCTLYDLFIADLDPQGLPQTQRFIDIFDPFCLDDGNTNGLQYRSLGIPVMLKGFIYYCYVRDADFAQVITGNIKNTFSNSEHARSVEVGIGERYNRAITSYDAIQWFICDNSSTYPEFNGKTKDITTWL